MRHTRGSAPSASRRRIVAGRRLRALALAGILASIGACSGSDSTSPTSATLAGDYTATTFTLAQGSTTTDVLAAGGSLSITLTNSGTTTGRLVIPASLNDGVIFDESMEGTYTASNGSVTFVQSADTFIRDITFTQSGSTLTGTRTFNGATIKVVLAKATSH